MIFDTFLPDVVHGTLVDGDQVPYDALAVGLIGTFNVARQSGWEGSDNQDGHFGGRGDVIIVAAQR
jgi:hypothetical protein